VGVAEFSGGVVVTNCNASTPSCIRLPWEGGALLLAAQPGLGKSALVAVAARMAAAAGTQVVQACGVQFEADVSYSTLNQLLLPLQDDFDRLDRKQRAALSVALGFTGGGQTDQSLVAEATIDLLRSASAVRPLLLLVDDLHWSDPMSAAVLGRVARALADSRVGLLAPSGARWTASSTPPG
jgi:predicted ATPase